MTDDPISKLKTPKESDPIPNMVELILNGNGVSLTYGINELIKAIAHKDPLGKVTSELAGDWQELQRSSQAIQNLAEYNKAFSSSIYTATSIMRGSWEGNAADSAGEYFGTMARAIEEQINALREISDEIDRFATTSYQLAGLAAGAVQSLVDNTMIAMAILAASAAAKAGVVTAPASLNLDVLLAAQIVKVIIFFYKLIGLLGDIFTTAQGVVGTLMALSSEVSFTDLKELPESGYKHPGVKTA